MAVRIDSSWRGRVLAPLSWAWEPRDAILYALGTGAAPPRDLPLLFEGAGPLVSPTFGTAPTGIGFLPLVAELGLRLGDVLHGEQHIEWHRPLDASGSVRVERRIAEVWDKGRAAVLVVDDQAEGLMSCRSSWFVTGAGGFGGERGPGLPPGPAVPVRMADVRCRRTVRPEQSALYRLSGDLNPVHIDPDTARAEGFDGTFLHGLCTFGMAGLELLMEICGGDSGGLRAFDARFVAPVRAGQDLDLELWQEGRTVVVRGRVGGQDVLSGSARLSA